MKYLVFDSKFTTYEQLRQLDEQGIKFITIRRRGSRIVQDLNALSPSQWKKLRVPTPCSNTRTLKVYEQSLTPKDYGKPLRQLALSAHGKEKPALIISNDFDLAAEQIVRKGSTALVGGKGYLRTDRVFSSQQTLLLDGD